MKRIGIFGMLLMVFLAIACSDNTEGNPQFEKEILIKLQGYTLILDEGRDILTYLESLCSGNSGSVVSRKDVLDATKDLYRILNRVNAANLEMNSYMVSDSIKTLNETQRKTIKSELEIMLEKISRLEEQTQRLNEFCQNSGVRVI